MNTVPPVKGDQTYKECREAMRDQQIAALDRAHQRKAEMSGAYMKLSEQYNYQGYVLILTALVTAAALGASGFLPGLAETEAAKAAGFSAERLKAIGDGLSAFGNAAPKIGEGVIKFNERQVTRYNLESTIAKTAHDQRSEERRALANEMARIDQARAEHIRNQMRAITVR